MKKSPNKTAQKVKIAPMAKIVERPQPKKRTSKWDETVRMILNTIHTGQAVFIDKGTNSLVVYLSSKAKALAASPIKVRSQKAEDGVFLWAEAKES